MNKKAKIIVLKMKELIYTLLFLLFGILLVVIFILMFSTPGDSSSNALYTPGQYTTSLTLGGNVVDISVTVDETSITSITLTPLEESITVMYPLMEPALEELSRQILTSQRLDAVEYSDEHQYTSMILLDAISTSLAKAKLPDNSN